MNESALRTLLSQLEGSSGGDPAALQTFERETGIQIPPEYRQILARHDGGDVQLGTTELTLWSASYLSQAHSEFEFDSALPGAFLFASDQNADAYGFDLRPGSGESLIKVPMIGTSWSAAIAMGDSLEDLLENLARS